MSDTDLTTLTEDAPTPDGSVPAEVVKSMQDQAAGMIAMDVESFSNGFMQIMLAGIGWASAEITKTQGGDGEAELTFFTEKLSSDLPQIIQNITAASKGEYQPTASAQSVRKQTKNRMFSK